jgi:hypothetical protein
MKFEEIFEDYKIGEWTNFYIDYFRLDNLLKKINFSKLSSKPVKHIELSEDTGKSFVHIMEPEASQDDMFISKRDTRDRVVSDATIDQNSSLDMTKSTQKTAKFLSKNLKDLEEPLMSQSMTERRIPMLANLEGSEEFEKSIFEELLKVERFYQQRRRDLLRLFESFFQTMERIHVNFNNFTIQ